MVTPTPVQYAGWRQVSSLVPLLSLIAILLLLTNCTTDRTSSLTQGGHSTITRTLTPAPPYTTGQTLTVNLVVSPGPITDCPAGNDAICNDYYVLDDTLPPTTLATTTDPACEVLASQGRFVCIVLQDATPHTHTYTLTLPSSPGTLSFGGHTMFQGDTRLESISGTQTLTIGQPQTITNTTTCGTCSTLSNTTCGTCTVTTTCTPTWQCDAWGPWTDTTCGTRTRTCLDTTCNTTSTTAQTQETSDCLARYPFTLQSIFTPTTLAILAVGVLIFLGLRKRKK